MVTIIVLLQHPAWGDHKPFEQVGMGLIPHVITCVCHCRSTAQVAFLNAVKLVLVSTTTTIIKRTTLLHVDIIEIACKVSFTYTNLGSQSAHS